ncbi:MAG: FAD binding domain-containing protein [Bdellovibrionota bacterium]
MRKSIILFVNGEREELSPETSLMTVAEFLRYKKGLTGTKVVCSEGDCGACTILVARMQEGKLGPYKAINSCISFMYLLDQSHLITVEGLKKNNELHPVQEAMVKNHGAQCGFCTPGFICAMASLTEDAKKENFPLEEKRVKNYLTGNLCRCTGYDSIIKSGCSVQLSSVPELSSFYDDAKIEKELATLKGSVRFSHENKSVFLPATLDEAALEKKEKSPRLAAGATDLGVVHNKGKLQLTDVMSLNNISSLYKVEESATHMIVGARASLDEVEKKTAKAFPEFSRNLHIFASPQIKNSGTLVGNLVNASPIADTIPFLRVAEAEVVMKSGAGERTVNVNAFIKGGYKELDMRADEIVSHIRLPKSDHQFKLYKISSRKDLDISTVTMAVRYKLKGNVLEEFSLALGGVGPTVLRMTQIEAKAIGQYFNQALFKRLASDVKASIKPLSDVRGSTDFRLTLCHNLMLKFCDEVMRENNISFQEISI